MASTDFRKTALAACKKALNREASEKPAPKVTSEPLPGRFRPPPYICPQEHHMQPRLDARYSNYRSSHHATQAAVQANHHGHEPLHTSPPNPQNEYDRKPIYSGLNRYLQAIGVSFGFDVVLVVKVPVHVLQQDPTRDIVLAPLAIYIAHGSIPFPLQFPVSEYRALTRVEMKLHNRSQLPAGCTSGLSWGEVVNSTMYIASCFSASPKPSPRSFQSSEYMNYVLSYFASAERSQQTASPLRKRAP